MFAFIVSMLLCVSDCGPGGCRIATRTVVAVAAPVVVVAERSRGLFRIHPRLHPIARAIYQRRHTPIPTK